MYQRRGAYIFNDWQEAARRQHSVPTTRATKIQTKHEKRLKVALNSRAVAA
jgi:hypothetical protein